METMELVKVEGASKKISKKKVAGIVGAVGALMAVGGTIAYKLISKKSSNDEDDCGLDEDYEEVYDEEEEVSVEESD